MGLEIELKKDGSFKPILNNYYYKIYKNNNLKRSPNLKCYILIRFIFNVNLLKNIFTGNTIDLKGRFLTGKISFENRIEIMKLSLLEEEIFNLQKIGKEKLLQEENSFYSLALLFLKEQEKDMSTWINIKLSKVENLNIGDTLIIKNIHEIKGNDYDLLEIIETSPISSKEIQDEKIIGYKKTCKVKIEKILKK